MSGPDMLPVVSCRGRNGLSLTEMGAGLVVWCKSAAFEAVCSHEVVMSGTDTLPVGRSRGRTWALDET